MHGKPDWTVAFPKVDKDGHTHWKQIGVGFNQRNNKGITITLDALPLPQTHWDGILSVYPVRSEERQPAPETSNGQ